MNPQTIYIGIDDTDILGGPGTGRVAKGLVQALVELGSVKSQGVSRHQLLIDPRVKSTSHNSSKGLALVTERPEEDFYEPAINYLKSCFVEGADPGLCICPEAKINPEILDYARSAQTHLLEKEDASQLANKYGVFLRELGGDGGGIIGALASVGLRAGGNDGRLVDLRGIKSVAGMVSVGEVLERTDIVRVQDLQGNRLTENEIIESRDWLRPSLVDGQPVLVVKPGLSREGKPAWLSIEKKFKEMVQEMSDNESTAARYSEMNKGEHQDGK